MIFSEIEPKIKNLGNFKSLEEIKKTGLRIVKTKNDDYWLIEKEFLRPVIKSPREVKTIVIQPEDLKYKVFMCHQSKKELRGTYALEYIRWGAKQGYHERPTCRGRPRWWELEENYYFDIIIPRTFNDLYICYRGGVNFSDRFYGIITRRYLQPFLNSTVFVLLCESLAKEALGLGALDLNIIELVKIPVFVTRKLKKLSTRPIKSIFEEVGLPKPNRDYSNINPDDVSLDMVMPDRRELDRIIFDALGLTKDEQLEIYRAVVELVKNRLVKAKSV